MNQVTTRNELKDQIQEIRSKNLEIEQKATIYARIHFKMACPRVNQHLQAKQLTHIKTHLST